MKERENYTANISQTIRQKRSLQVIKERLLVKVQQHITVIGVNYKAQIRT